MAFFFFRPVPLNIELILTLHSYRDMGYTRVYAHTQGHSSTSLRIGELAVINLMDF